MRRKTWLLFVLAVVLAAFLVPWRAAADKIGVLVNGTFYLDIGTLLSGSGVTGVTVANEASDTSCFPVFVTADTGALGPKSNAGLTFNSATGMLTATGVTSTLTGTSTGLSGTPNVTVGTVSAGAGGMTVDADGDVVAKSLTTTRTDSPDYLQVYEATSDGDNSVRWMAPAKGTGFSSTNYYRFPAAAPSGGQVMSFPTPSDNSTQAVWVTPLVNTTGEAILSSTTLPLNADGNTTLYTVPAGKTAVLTKAVLVAGADAGSSDITIGQAGALTDFLGTQQCDNADAAGDVLIFTNVPNATPVKQKAYAAGTIIKAVVANQAGGATNTLHLFGFLY